MATIPQLEAALLTATNRGDFAEVASIVEALPPSQKTEVNALLYNEALTRMATSSADADGLASAVRTLVASVGEHTSAFALGDALVGFAQKGNLAAVHGLLDVFPSSKKAEVPVFLLDEALHGITLAQPFDATATAQAMRAYAAQFAEYLSGQALGDALVILAQGENFAAVEGILDNLSPEKRAEVPPHLLDEVVQAALAESEAVVVQQDNMLSGLRTKRFIFFG